MTSAAPHAVIGYRRAEAAPPPCAGGLAGRAGGACGGLWLTGPGTARYSPSRPGTARYSHAGLPQGPGFYQHQARRCQGKERGREQRGGQEDQTYPLGGEIVRDAVRQWEGGCLWGVYRGSWCVAKGGRRCGCPQQGEQFNFPCYGRNPGLSGIKVPFVAGTEQKILAM